MTRTLELLEDARTFVRRYVVLPDEHHAAAMALWVAHTWAIDAAHATPYLLVLSAERRSGKSRLLEVVALLVRKPWSVVAASEAAMFRKIAAERPTLLLDELDAIFGSDAERTEWLRAVLNAGNRPGVAVARCVGPGHEVRDFEVFCPKLLAGIDTGRLPDTIRDRAVELRLQRKTDDEPVARFRQRYAEIESLDLRNRLEEWAAEHEDALRAAEPNLPNALNDRAADAWEALLAIADLAGGQWPALARDAAVALIPSEEEANPHGSRVLAVLRHISDGSRVVATSDLLTALNGNDELPFGGWRKGEGIDARAVAKLLRPYELKPRTVRLEDGSTAKGYARDAALEDAFARYLPPEHDATVRHTAPHEGLATPAPNGAVTHVTHVTAPGGGAGYPIVEYEATNEEEALYARLRNEEWQT